MTYLKLRVKVYIDELKQMLSSIRQLFIFISLLFNMALPVAVLTALISLSVIESSQTVISSRISYQWGYFIFLFFYFFSLEFKEKPFLGIGGIFIWLVPQQPKCKNTVLTLF